MSSLPPSRFPFANFPHLTPRQWFQLGGSLLVLLLVVRFAYTFFLLLLLGALICLCLGWQQPERFRFLFGTRTSKSTVAWVFGSALCLFSVLVASLEPKEAASVSNPAKQVAVQPAVPAVAPVPATDSPQLVQAQERAQQAEARAERAEKRAAALAAKNTASSGSQTQSDSQVEQAIPSRASRPLPSDSPSRNPAPTLSPKQLFQQLMAEQFGERLRDVQAQREGQDWSVEVEFDRRERLTKGATINYLEGDMKAAYKALFTSGLPLSHARLTAYGEGTDVYGNAVQAPIYKTQLAGDVAQAINWDNYEKAQWESLWIVDFVHPAYRKKK